MIDRGKSAAGLGLARRAGLGLLSAIAAGGLASAAQAEGTVAGTQIENVATATYDGPAGETVVTSNKVSLQVDELIDVSVAWADPGNVVVSPGALTRVLSFRITNAGNGSEAFRLSAAGSVGGDDFDPTVTAIVLDTNGNGAYDPGADTIYVAGSNDPVLAADASVSVFVISAIPASAQNGHRGRIDLKAVAKTGSGAPGTTFAGAGQGGGNAVMGASGADAEDDGYYSVASASLSFVKSALVADPFGGATKVPGATITYTLVAKADGSGSFANVRVADPVPTGTTYAPGSITLDGAALSDAEDSDSGRFTGTGISVALGNVAGGSTRTITFKVKID
jgi:uncharacterized repeat protein (TIGR01451 family)